MYSKIDGRRQGKHDNQSNTRMLGMPMTLTPYKAVTLLVHVQAGSGAGGRVAQQVAEGVRTLFSQSAVEIVETQSKEHIQSIGSSSEADLIICLTGDGSMHDLAQTLILRPAENRPTISSIPAGSGNDYARTLGMPSDPLEALAALPLCREVEADVGKVNDVYFLETLSFGVDAAVALNTEELRLTTKTRGLRLYARAAISAIFNELNAHTTRITIEGNEITQETLICAVQNGPTYGSGFKVAPRASITDGMLDVCTVSGVGKLAALYYLSQMKGGKHMQLKGVSNYRAPELKIEFTEQLPIQCDGERLLGTSFNIKVMPAALTVLASPDAAVS